MTPKPKKNRAVLAEYEPEGPPHYDENANWEYFVVAGTKNLIDERDVSRRFKLILEEI